MKLILKADDADMGIRTPVVGVKGRHDWPLHYISHATKVLYKVDLWK